MDPIRKWRLGRRFPYKLALQVVKIFFVTIQLVLFAKLRTAHVEFAEDTTTVLRHKFLTDWTAGRDVDVYPPASGRYSAFTVHQLWQTVAFAIRAYYTIDESFAKFDYFHPHFGIDEPSRSIPAIEFCTIEIASVTVNNGTYIFDTDTMKKCQFLDFTNTEIAQIRNCTPGEDTVHLLTDMLTGRDVHFWPLKLIEASLHFNLSTIHFSSFVEDNVPECYEIQTRIELDNSRHSGQVIVSLHNDIFYVQKCSTMVGAGSNKYLARLLDALVLTICSASLVLCCRAILRAQLLKNITVDFFKRVFDFPLSSSEKLEFLNLWFVMIVLNDVLIILGTICKMSIEFKDFDNGLFTLTGISLGFGTLLVYGGVLRYFGFFSQYNILILTLKKSLPAMLRFTSCAAFIFAGFLFAGWVIIGPYSLKFRTLSKSSEALFSLLNGDDMFATFFTIREGNRVITVFSTVYIYSFVSLFSYVVLSLFIAIIMDAYEVVKDHYDCGHETGQKTPLRTFIDDFSSSNDDDEDDREDVDHFHDDSMLRLGDIPGFFRWIFLRFSPDLDHLIVSIDENNAGQAA